MTAVPPDLLGTSINIDVRRKREYVEATGDMRPFFHVTIGIAAFFVGVVSVWIVAPRVEAPLPDQMATTTAPDLVLPEIVSAVPDIEVVHAEPAYDMSGTPQIELYLRNNSDQDVNYLYLESHTCRDGSGQGWERSSGPPVIAAHETTRTLVSYQNVIPGRPLTIAYVRYANDTTAGKEDAGPTGCKC
jgi:hypothetical protein